MSDQSKKTVSLDIREQVSSRYGEIAATGGSCCCGGGQTADQHAQAIGYTLDQIAELPDGANLGLGCGNPTTLTMIEPGMTVVDLGSGAGIDCFLAAKRVGPTGRVIGVDMTDAMLEKARQFAQEKGFTNVEFRKGVIEDLPIDDASVDLIISNCVINLSPDKPRVFKEIARVLKPGGRLAVSDIVLLQPLPDAVRQDLEAYIGCIAGAEPIDAYLAHVAAAGLAVEKAQKKSYDVLAVLGCSPEAGKLVANLPEDFKNSQSVASLDVVAMRPAER